jgi:hypothetical protein
MWCLKQYEQRKETQKWLSNYLEITTRHFRTIYATYKQTGQIPQTKMGRPKKQITKQLINIIDEEWQKTVLMHDTLKQ